MSCHLQVGKKKEVAFVFSCPGRYEEIEGGPAAKVTGKNLSSLLAKLRNSLNNNNLFRKNITITNAWSRVEYKKKTGRSEADISEITSDSNVCRLRSELAGVSDLIVCCGDKAKVAVEACNLPEGVKIAFIKHLGTRGLNSIKTDADGADIISADILKKQGDRRSKRRIQNDNTSRRIDVVCQSITNQIQTQ
ncbi:hypothetical protein [Oceanospirillum beijerinckii]|uniref:hypothetical protein n=1 Tax=Oceanospirillum beijerinckii TaxID=64976 RepID=UPI0004856478|nr:hypothetical protein [Oceanospirillum beijerinckii]